MKFIKYDANTGSIISSGEMPESSIDYLNDQGQNLIKTYDTFYDINRFKVNLDTMSIEPVNLTATTPKLPYLSLKNAIKNELQKTDYTQTLDAPDYMSTDMINAYKDYRMILRNALDQPDYSSMVMVLPGASPTGQDVFSSYKQLIIPGMMENISNVVVNVVYTNE